MKKMKVWLLIFCMLLGFSGCSNEEIFGELNTILNEYLEQEQKINVPDGELEVHFLDVGQADCAFLVSGEHYMLIDGGNNDDAAFIVSYLQNAGVEKLDMVVGTHPHEDHIGSLDAVIDAFEIGAIYMPDASVDTDTYRDVMTVVSKKGLQVKHPAAGDVLEFGGLPVEIFGPVKNYSNLNNNSIVMRISVGETAFLFTGDAETEAEFDILEVGFDVSADVLKVSHHGSATASVEEYLAFTDAEYAIISVGEGNTYDHPESVVLNRLGNYGMKVYRTDQQGTIICRSDGKGISVETTGKRDHSSEVTDASFIGNKKSLKFHTWKCSSLPLEKNRAYFIDREMALEEGYSPCGSCYP